MENWNGKKVLVIGAARQGQALARFMSNDGAKVIINDSKPIEKLAEAQQSLEDLPLEWITGSHPESLLDRVDLICVTGGADLRIPILQSAFNRGIPVINDAQIFLSRVKAPVIGITGSSGKTTTTTLVGRMAEAAKKASQKVFVGGNIGLPMLNFINEVNSNDIVILELSSFQLELVRKSPHVSAILNITPNHLDRHVTMEAYTAAKMNIMNWQQPQDIAVLFRENEITWNLRHQCKGKLVSFGFSKPEPGISETAIYLDQNSIRSIKNEVDTEIMKTSSILLRGRHNICNVMAACAIASAAGFPPDAMRAGVEGFKGVQHRLEWVREYHGAVWYNDSIATAPERTLAAVHSFTEPLVMLLGGRDKKLPWDELCSALQSRARVIVLFGEAAPLIQSALLTANQGNGPLVISCESLQEAVIKAAEQCQAGDVVLLSPGGTSYDAFIDFEERGRKFSEWVQQLK